MSEKPKKTKTVLSKKGKTILNIILVAALIVACISGYKLVSGLIGYKQADQKYQSLQTEAKVTPSTTAGAATAVPETTGINWSYLQSQNPNVAAWINSPNTVIDYPVTYAEDNEYYLSHLFDGTSNYSGCVFIDYRNKHDFADKNTVMYAHYMYNGEGTMFTSLHDYVDQSYYDAHKTITFDTPTALYRMEVMAGIETTGDADYIHLEFSSGDDFLSYVKSFTDNSTFKSDVTVTANDQIVTLSTCSPNEHDGRYALMGKLVKVQDYNK